MLDVCPASPRRAWLHGIPMQSKGVVRANRGAAQREPARAAQRKGAAARGRRGARWAKGARLARRRRTATRVARCKGAAKWGLCARAAQHEGGAAPVRRKGGALQSYETGCGRYRWQPVGQARHIWAAHGARALLALRRCALRPALQGAASCDCAAAASAALGAAALALRMKTCQGTWNWDASEVTDFLGIPMMNSVPVRGASQDDASDNGPALYY